MNNIPIFFTFNNDYTIPAAVAFFSLLNKAKENVFYEMYILHSDITEENQKLLLNIVAKFKNAKLIFSNTKDFLKEEWSKGNFEGHQNKHQFTSETLIKCFGAKFFPQYDKIIYSDVDIVVTEDISDIYTINLNDKYIAGVKSPFTLWSKDELSHLDEKHYNMLKNSYLGGGIWVMNLKKIREDKLEQKIINIINDNSIIKRWPDQDIINIVCENKVEFLPLNYISYPYLNDLLKKQDFVSTYSREELFDSIINPKIIHYAAVKPWNGSPHKKEIWWEIFNYLELPKTKIFKDSEDNRIKRKYKRLLIILTFIFILLSILNSLICFLIFS